MCFYSALLGMDAVCVAWSGAVCSFVRDACAHAVKNRLNRACVGDVGVVGFEIAKLQLRAIEAMGEVCILCHYCGIHALVDSTPALT